jgi:DNA-binding NarL/FixJ family response regulator
MAINVLIADQERTFADLLAARIDDEDDMAAVGAIEVKAPISRLPARKPVEIIVLDGDLPGDAANRLCEKHSGSGKSTRVITLSVSSEPERIVQAIRAGTAAWVRKDESLEYLLRVIRGVARGESWLPPNETAHVLQLLLRAGERRGENERLLGTLTKAERAVLACLAKGAANRVMVAEQLHLSVNTVRTHLRNLMSKLGVHSMLEAVAITRNNPDGLRGDGAGEGVAAEASHGDHCGLCGRDIDGDC